MIDDFGCASHRPPIQKGVEGGRFELLLGFMAFDVSLPKKLEKNACDDSIDVHAVDVWKNFCFKKCIDEMMLIIQKNIVQTFLFKYGAHIGLPGINVHLPPLEHGMIDAGNFSVAEVSLKLCPDHWRASDQARS